MLLPTLFFKAQNIGEMPISQFFSPVLVQDAVAAYLQQRSAASASSGRKAPAGWGDPSHPA